ncbi:Uncharacterised protein [Sphingobacterium multivorum]|uniref:VOC family protein n=1 Tax=Sphingobacterium multivorum TaxID=28454 RepID=UPI000E05EBB0|nr:VOC family protein [Sphingobacterium multivorum]QQT46641.1 VOC family protein [Sphingobacterium multivorum]SUJ89307.1 Uncharacterised protein [Sphingobacterium multivorum]
MRQDIFAGFFQLGYVTKDIDVACKSYTKKFGVKFKVVVPDENTPGFFPVKRMAFTRIGATVIKIVEPHLTEDNIFSRYVVENPRVVRLHHLGYLIEDYQKALRKLSLLEYDIPLKETLENGLEYFYADTRNDLGHYSEFIRLDNAGKDFLASITSY